MNYLRKHIMHPIEDLVNIEGIHFLHIRRRLIPNDTSRKLSHCDLLQALDHHCKGRVHGVHRFAWHHSDEG